MHLHARTTCKERVRAGARLRTCLPTLLPAHISAWLGYQHGGRGGGHLTRLRPWCSRLVLRRTSKQKTSVTMSSQKPAHMSTCIAPKNGQRVSSTCRAHGHSLIRAPVNHYTLTHARKKLRMNGQAHTGARTHTRVHALFEASTLLSCSLRRRLFVCTRARLW